MLGQIKLSARDDVHPAARILVTAAAIVFIVWGISEARSVLVSSLVSVFFAVLATPFVRFLERKRIPTGLAVSLAVISMISALLAIGLVVGASASDFYAALPHYQALVREQLVKLNQFFANNNIAAPEKLLRDHVDPEAIMQLAAGMFASLGVAFSNVILIVLTVTFILLEAKSFPVKLRAILGDPQERFPRFTAFVNNMKRYMLIKTLMSLATGVLIAVWLTILNIDFPILWGFVGFLLNYVPTLGSAIAGTPATFLALVEFGVVRAALVALGFMTINFVLDNVIEKKIMGSQLGLSTLVVFLSLIFWGSLLGPIGAVLCIPLTITAKFAFESNDATRWIAVLLGPAYPKSSAKKAKKNRPHKLSPGA